MDSAVNTRQADPHVNPALSTQEIEQTVSEMENSHKNYFAI
jgi:hypothetical protein